LAPRPSPRRTEVGLYLPLNLRHLKVPPTLTLDLEGSQRHLTPPLLQVIIVASLIPRLLILLGLHDALSYGIELGHLEDCIICCGHPFTFSCITTPMSGCICIQTFYTPRWSYFSLGRGCTWVKGYAKTVRHRLHVLYCAGTETFVQKKKTVRPRQFTAWGTEKALL